MAPKSLCLTTAVAPVPAFLGRSCPLGCSLSAPATGGFSVVSPQYIRYAAGPKEEKRAGGRLHGDTIAHLFFFCNGGALSNRPPSTRAGTEGKERGGLWWRTPLSHLARPPTFLETEGHAVPPAPRLGDGGGGVCLPGASEPASQSSAEHGGRDRGLPQLGQWGRRRGLGACSKVSQTRPRPGQCFASRLRGSGWPAVEGPLRREDPSAACASWPSDRSALRT